MLYDIVVIGGGINGCGCAADAAMRGLSVLLCEQSDLAAHTSSQSSKLIHGGLRYLEQYQFKLVRQALEEQHILMNIAPHLIRPLAFVLPYRRGLRPAWLLRCGLFLYDHLSRKNTLPNSKTLTRQKHADYFPSLQTDTQKGFLFYDAQVHDARLTISVALQAQAHGATILPHSRFLAAKAEQDHWRISLKNQEGKIQDIQAKAIINAAGPWAHQIAQACQQQLRASITYVQGSHIVAPAFYSGNHAYLLQTPEQRVVFVMPFHGHTLIGTTEIVVPNPNTQPKISQEEIHYFKDIIHTYFQHTITDIITAWSGIRALPTQANVSPSQLSRDYYFELQSQPLPIITILSGKLTTYRRLSAEVINRLSSVFPNLPRTSTDKTPLPGADWPTGYDDYILNAQHRYGWLEPQLLNHYLHTYGTRTDLLLKDCKTDRDLGMVFGTILRQKEVDFLRESEWAQTAEDVLWRRTQLGLTISDEDRMALEAYLS